MFKKKPLLINSCEGVFSVIILLLYLYGTVEVLSQNPYKISTQRAAIYAQWRPLYCEISSRLLTCRFITVYTFSIFHKYGREKNFAIESLSN